MEAHRVAVGEVSLHVGATGRGDDVVMLSGGPGCVQYLEDPDLTIPGHRFWFPEPRGVGRSTGGPHDMSRAIADLEAIRHALGIAQWTVVGHSWGSDLAIRYAVENPSSVARVLGIAGHGLHHDRTWSAAYEAGAAAHDGPDIVHHADVHAELWTSFREWIHQPMLWRNLADCRVPVRLLAAELDFRPDWPLRQLGELLPAGSFGVIPDVPHDLWDSHPTVWREVLARELAAT